MKVLIRVAAPALVVLLAVAPVKAAPTTRPSAAGGLSAARDHFVHGRYKAALTAYAALAKSPALAARAEAGAAEVHVVIGAYAEAEKACKRAVAADPKDARAHNVYGDLLTHLGRYDEAAVQFTAAGEIKTDALRTQLGSARLFEVKGAFEKADRLFGGFIDVYNSRDVADPEELILIGEACVAYARRHPGSDMFDTILNDLFLKAAKHESTAGEAHLAAGMLLLDKYNVREAAEEFQATLKVNPNHPDAHLGLALAALNGYKVEQARQHLGRVLKINPEHVQGRILEAWIAMSQDRLPAALPAVERALRVNPNDIEARAVAAAVHERMGHAERRDAEMKRIAAVNPKSALPFFVLGRAAEDERQFTPAERYYKRAIKLEPYLPDAHTSLGQLYMRAGREDDAESLLAEAFRLDPYNARTLRVKKLLARLKEFAVVETDHFVFKYDAGKERVLGRVVPDALERLYPAVCRRFTFEPPRKTLIEIFPTHHGFSVRTTGQPWIGTIGACTGWVVAMASPRAVSRHRFNWERVLTHEFVHIVTLQATDMRMPHWFTEGLAVSQEGLPPQQRWVVLLSEAVADDRLIPLADLNRGFTRPKSQNERQLAYAQSEQMVDLIRARYGGEAAILAMIKAYTAGKPTPQVIKDCLHLTVPDLEKQTRTHIRTALANDGVVDWQGRDPDAAKKASDAHPADLDLRIQFAWALLSRRRFDDAAKQARAALKKAPANADALALVGRVHLAKNRLDEASKALHAALKADPDHAHALLYLALVQQKRKDHASVITTLERLEPIAPSDPRVLSMLAGAYTAADKPDRAAAMLERLLTVQDDTFKAATQLAALHTKAGRHDRAAEAWRALCRLNPFDADAYCALADCWKHLKRPADRVSALETANDLRGYDAAILAPLAEAYLDAGRKEKAREAAGTALKLDRDNATARSVMQRLSGGGVPDTGTRRPPSGV